jgi:hypothetical protein
MKKMKKITLLLVCLLSNFMFSHTINHGNSVLRHWSIEKNHKFIEGTFMMFKNGTVFIEDVNNTISKFPLTDLSKEDQSFVMKKEEWVKNLNTISPQKQAGIQSVFDYKFWIILFSLFALGYYIYTLSDRKKLKYLYPVLFFGILMSLYSFTKKALSITDPLFLKSAFNQFSSTVSTTYDANYFYVNSKGVPNHTMMVGISSTGWQQQIPIPQCYIGANAWSIPLNPVIAGTPVPVSASHFLKGAIAIAANGVAIFNYHTNTGVDSFLDGQLDNYGGHCGRADDYHYHTAPMHLITLGQASATLPIAFGLDGYAVYGSLEPTGASMTTLDANHGHFLNGVYHYHGTATAPYMIGNMVGVVTEDVNLQIIPQASANSVRGPGEGQNPLRGALITSCVPNATNNGYNLSFSYNGTPGSATNFSWNGTAYTFNYVNYPTTISINNVVTTPPNPGTLVSNRTGQAQCVVPNLGINEHASIEKNIIIFPNPAADILQINVGNAFLENDVQNISIYDIKGSLVSKTPKFTSSLNIKNLSKGTYFVKIQFSNSVVTKKLLVK